MLTLPIEPGDPDQSFSTVIDTQLYHFRLRWSERSALWSMDVLEADETSPIALGLPVVGGVYIGNQRPHPVFSSGVFVVRYTEGKLDGDPSLEDLGVTKFLVYMPMSDLVATLFGA